MGPGKGKLWYNYSNLLQTTMTSSPILFLIFLSPFIFVYIPMFLPLLLSHWQLYLNLSFPSKATLTILFWKRSPIPQCHLIFIFFCVCVCVVSIVPDHLHNSAFKRITIGIKYGCFHLHLLECCN